MVLNLGVVLSDVDILRGASIAYFKSGSWPV